MAERRMISKALITSDEYTDLSFEAQALYVQLTVEADDFGFVNGVKKIMRSIGVNADTLDELEKAHFVIRFDSGVFVIRHWFYANFGGDFNKNDRTISTRFFDELTRLTVDVNAAYVLLDSAGTPMELQWNPDGVPSIVQYSPVQSRVIEYIRRAVKKSTDKSSGSINKTTTTPQPPATNGAPAEPTGDNAGGGGGDLIPEILEYAREKAKGARNPAAYEAAILDRIRKAGYKTIEEVIAADEDRRKKPEQQPVYAEEDDFY